LERGRCFRVGALCSPSDAFAREGFVCAGERLRPAS
jgi:hypothetical protein